MQRAWKYVSKAIQTRQISLSATNRESSQTLLDVNDKTGVATLTLNCSPINALNRSFLAAIRTRLEELQGSKARGLILTSSLRSIFSAGLDITELYKTDKDVLTELWTNMQDVGLLLNTLPIPTVALINGHAPAGGCVLATTCEYRIMLPNFTIGLNEPVLGITPPKWIIDLMLEAMPRRTAELALTKGKLFLSEQALKAGLVDEIVDNKETGLKRCETFFQNFTQVDPEARAATKRLFRHNDLLVNRKQDLDFFVDQILRPDVQESIGIYLRSLKKRQ